jgi:hypothetical protein
MNETSTGGIFFASVGPTLVKKLQNLSAIFVGSINVSLSDMNLVGIEGLLSGPD